MANKSKKLNWVYFLSVISVNQCSINNDFEGIRLNSDGVIYTTDVSRKYLMKRYMKDVLDFEVAGLPDKNNKGMYFLFKNQTTLIKTLENLNTEDKQLEEMNKFKDISMFGYLFTDTFGKNDKIKLSQSTLTGYLQISNGINIGSKNNIVNMTIINGNKDKNTSAKINDDSENDDNGDIKSGSVGSKQIIEEAYILNVITINPNQFKETYLLFNNEETLTPSFEENISIIEKILCNDANSFRTTSRNNIFNEALVKIESSVALNLGNLPLTMKDGKIIFSNKLKQHQENKSIIVTEILNETK